MILKQYKKLDPYVAWDPLPNSEWDAQSAAHLLRRIGFSSTPNKTQETVERGLSATIKYYFGKQRKMPMPSKMKFASQDTFEMRQKMMTGSPEEQKIARREMRIKFNEATVSMG